MAIIRDTKRIDKDYHVKWTSVAVSKTAFIKVVKKDPERSTVHLYQTISMG